jgi:hypothetical protein
MQPDEAEHSLNMSEIRDYVRSSFDPEKRAAQWIKMGMRGSLTSATNVGGECVRVFVPSLLRLLRHIVLALV